MPSKVLDTSRKHTVTLARFHWLQVAGGAVAAAVPREYGEVQTCAGVRQLSYQAEVAAMNTMGQPDSDAQPPPSAGSNGPAEAFDIECGTNVGA